MDQDNIDFKDKPCWYCGGYHCEEGECYPVRGDGLPNIFGPRGKTRYRVILKDDYLENYISDNSDTNI